MSKKKTLTFRREEKKSKQNETDHISDIAFLQ